MSCFFQARLHNIVLVVLSLCVQALGIPNALSEHVPANWDDMELHKWYNLVPEIPPIFNIIEDPCLPGRLYGLQRDSNLNSYPVTSEDNGETWISYSDGLIEPINELNCSKCTVIKTGADTRKIYMIVSTTGQSDNVYLYCKEGLDTPWIKLHECSSECSFNSVSAHSSGIVLMTRKTQQSAEILRSDDFGHSWQTVFSNTSAEYYFQAEFSPFDNGVVYICGWAHDGTAVMKSTDWGATWQTTGFPWETVPIPHYVFFHPTQPETVFIVVEEILHDIPYCIKVSHDGGTTWDDFGPRSDTEKLQISSVFFDPTDTSVILATGAMSQIWKSLDSGQTWTLKLDRDSSVFNRDYGSRIRSSRLDPDSWSISHEGGQWISTDQGENWFKDKPYTSDRPLKGYNDPCNPERAVMARADGIFSTCNGGQDWTPGTIYSLRKEHNSQIPFAVDFGDSDLLYMALTGNYFVVTDNFGDTWHEKMGPDGHEKIILLRSSKSIPGKVFCIAETGVRGDVFISHNYGADWQQLTIEQGTNFKCITDSPHSSSVLYAVGIPSDGEKTRFYSSFDGGSTWNTASALNGYTALYPAGSIVVHPTIPGKVYSGSQIDDYMVSTDGGLSWSPSIFGASSYNGFFIHPTNPDIFLDFFKFSRDAGASYSETILSKYVNMPTTRLDTMFRINEEFLVCRFDNMGPTIQLLGYGDTHLIVNNEAMLTISAYVVDPSDHDRISHIEMLLNGIPTGFKIYPDGETSAEYIQFQSPIQPTSEFFGYFSWIAMDSFGNKSKPWPSLRLAVLTGTTWMAQQSL